VVGDFSEEDGDEPPWPTPVTRNLLPLRKLLQRLGVIPFRKGFDEDSRTANPVLGNFLTFRPTFVLSAATIYSMFQNISHQPLRVRKAPFDHSDYLFELKYDGFRALACIENSRCRLISRHGHEFGSFSQLEKSIETAVTGRTVLDGEIVCLDGEGRPQFEDLLFHRGSPCFFAFDVLVCHGRDLRTAALMDRKQELRRLLAKMPSDLPVRYVDHIDRTGVALFERVCAWTLRGSWQSSNTVRTFRPAKRARGSKSRTAIIRRLKVERNSSTAASMAGIHARRRARP
jgi:bifunctional non-homologous end joining protein LigD